MGREREREREREEIKFMPGRGEKKIGGGGREKGGNRTSAFLFDFYGGGRASPAAK